MALNLPPLTPTLRFKVAPGVDEVTKNEAGEAFVGTRRKKTGGRNILAPTDFRATYGRRSKPHHISQGRFNGRKHAGSKRRYSE